MVHFDYYTNYTFLNVDDSFFLPHSHSSIDKVWNEAKKVSLIEIENQNINPLLVVNISIPNVYSGYFAFGLYLNNSKCVASFAGDPKMCFIDYCYYYCYSSSFGFSLTVRMCKIYVICGISERILCAETIFRWWIWN